MISCFQAEALSGAFAQSQCELPTNKVCDCFSFQDVNFALFLFL